MFYTDEFLAYLRTAGFNKLTVNSYRYLLHNLKAFLLENNISHIKNITSDTMLAYIGKIKRKNHTTKCIADKISRLKRYFYFCEERNYIFISPVKDLKRPRSFTGSYPAIDLDEIRNILDSIKPGTPVAIKGKAIMELAYSSALRPCELYNLRIQDIDFGKGLLFIRQSKGMKDRLVPAGLNALYWVRQYIQKVRHRYVKKHTDYVFISHITGRKLTRFGIRSAVRKTLLMNGFDVIKPASLRTTSATALFLNGMDIASISTLLGHTCLLTTQVYLKVKTVELKHTLASLHPRNK